MQKALDETNRRREIQQQFNQAHGITPKAIVKAVRDTFEKQTAKEQVDVGIDPKVAKSKITKLTKLMHKAAEAFEFEQAAELRDQIKSIKEQLLK